MSNHRVIYGFHAVTSRLRRSPESVREIYLDPGRQDARARDLTALAQTLKVPLHSADTSTSPSLHAIAVAS